MKNRAWNNRFWIVVAIPFAFTATTIFTTGVLSLSALFGAASVLCLGVFVYSICRDR